MTWPPWNNGEPIETRDDTRDKRCFESSRPYGLKLSTVEVREVVQYADEFDEEVIVSSRELD